MSPHHKKPLVERQAEMKARVAKRHRKRKPPRMFRATRVLISSTQLKHARRALVLQRRARGRQRRLLRGTLRYCLSALRARRLLRAHGITVQQHTEMYAHQLGVCAICRKPKQLCVDSDSETNLIRGLLCRACLVKVRRISPQSPQNVIRYVTKPPVIAEWAADSFDPRTGREISNAQTLRFQAW